MTAREEKRLVDRLCSELPPISDKGRQFLQTLEAFARDKLVTVFATDLNSGFRDTTSLMWDITRQRW